MYMKFIDVDSFIGIHRLHLCCFRRLAVCLRALWVCYFCIGMWKCTARPHDSWLAMQWCNVRRKNTVCSFHVGLLTLFPNACMYTICMTYVWFKTCNFFTQESPYQSPNTRNEAVKLKWWHGITWWGHVTAHSLRSDACKGQGRNRPQQVKNDILIFVIIGLWNILVGLKIYKRRTYQ